MRNALAYDTEETIRSFDPQWSAPQAGGHRVALAFDCGSPGEVDGAWADLTGAGYEGHLSPWDAEYGWQLRSPEARPHTVTPGQRLGRSQ